MSTTAAAAPARVALLADGSLLLEVEAALRDPVQRWLPLLPTRPVRGTSGARVVRMRRGEAPPPPQGAAGLRLGTVQAWIADGRAWLHAPVGAGGALDLSEGTAELRVPTGAAGTPGAEWALYSMCTLSLALLLGRAGRALVHAAAPVDPQGRAWLLVGDTHAGKTTTTANLLAAGWRFTTDDHAVLSPGPTGAPVVEGLPRRFHVDDGWGSAHPRGTRSARDPHRDWPGRWMEGAPLGGILLPRVQRDAETALTAARPGTALTALIRQSPWLIADRAAAPGVLDLLRRAATLPAFQLTLGLDTFADPRRLATLLGNLP